MTPVCWSRAVGRGGRVANVKMASSRVRCVEEHLLLCMEMKTKVEVEGSEKSRMVRSGRSCGRCVWRERRRDFLL